VLSEDAIRKIQDALDTAESMISSDQDYPFEAFMAQLNRIEDIRDRDYSSEVISKVKDALQKAVSIPFPNFDINKYHIDLKTDTINRGNGDQVTESNATVAEKTLLDSYAAIVAEANDLDEEIDDHIQELKSHALGA